MSEIVIREVTHNVWTFSGPFTMVGMIPLGCRSIAIKLESGGVWVLASSPLTDETKQTLANLGEVKYIIAGNLFHNVFLGEFKKAYPTAKLIGPDGLQHKKELAGLTLDGVLSENTNTQFGYEDEIESVFFTGNTNKDTIFYHKASKTTIAPDLLFNNPPTEQYSKSSQSPTSLLFGGMTPTSWQMRMFLRIKTEDRAAMCRDAKKVDEWDFDRHIMCHGDVIETGAKAAWRSAWVNYLS